MKVLIAIPCLLQGGTEMQTLSLSKALRFPIRSAPGISSPPGGGSSTCGHEVFVVCYFEHEDMIVSEFLKTGTEVRLLDMNRKSAFFKFILRLKKEIQAIRPDVVHVQYMAPGAMPIIAAWLSGVKTVFATVHQPYTKAHGKLSKLILRIASLLTTRFITVSQNAEQSWFGKSCLFEENKLVKLQPHHFTIFNTVDTDRIHGIIHKTDRESLRNLLGIPADAPLVGSVSRLRHEKGIDLLIEAFKILVRENINAQLLIVGSGPDEKELRNQAVSFGIADKVIFYGSTDWVNAMELISIMDIVVVPSRFEGFGLTAAEAMTAGKPVVASDSFGLKEVVANNKTGLIFRTNDPMDLSEKLKHLLLNPELCVKYGEEGYKRVKSLFDLEIFSKKISALYGSY